LLGSEFWAEVLWINTGIVTIPLFKVDVPLYSECIRFGSELFGMEANDEVKTGKVFGPSCLLMCEAFGHLKVLQVPVIDDHIDRRSRAFKVMSPSFESFKNREELFVMDVIVEFQRGKGPGVECNGM